MHLSSFTLALLLPFLAHAQTTTFTATMTRTITVSEVVGTVTSTIASHNATSTFAAGTGSISTGATSAPASTTSAQTFKGAGAKFNPSQLSLAGLAALVAVAVL